MQKFKNKFIEIAPFCLNNSFLKKSGFELTNVGADIMANGWLRVIVGYKFNNEECHYKAKYGVIGSTGSSYSNGKTTETEISIDFQGLKYRWGKNNRADFGIFIRTFEINGKIYEPKFIENWKWEIAAYFAPENEFGKIKTNLF